MRYYQRQPDGTIEIREGSWTVRRDVAYETTEHGEDREGRPRVGTTILRGWPDEGECAEYVGGVILPPRGGCRGT